MNPRISLTAGVVAAVALAAPVVANAVEPDEVAGEAQQTITGEVVAVTDASGRTGYVLQLPEGSQVALSYGPSWSWGSLNPLAAFVGTSVEVAGHLGDGQPDEHASATAQERAAHQPKLHVKAVNGAALREGQATVGGRTEDRRRGAPRLRRLVERSSEQRQTHHQSLLHEDASILLPLITSSAALPGRRGTVS